MKLEIQSLGKISNASIRLDGITAIVGNNDAGKSTVGKALFTAIDAFHDFDEETEKELQQSLFLSVLSFLMSNIYALATQENGSLRPFTDTLSKRLLGLRGSPSEEDIRSALLHTRIMTSPPRYGSSIWAQYEKAVKEGPLSTEFIHNLQQLLSIPDTSFAAKYAGNTLKTMFGGQISNRIESVPADGFLRLENGKILSEMEFANDQVSQASFMMPNSTRVVMLDDPKAVDDTFDNADNISRRFNGIWESPYEREARALRRLLGRRGPNGSESSIANQILAQQDLSELTAHLANAFPFKISPSSDGRMLISGSKSNLSEPILASNASAGGKATMLLRYLFEEHMLRSGDFLILDEPEIHLHPQLQIAYARYIVGAAQKIGVRVLLTTHSPYFLQALTTYSQLFGFKQQLSVYSAQSQTNQSITFVEEDNKGIARIFENMAQPFLTLERDIANDLTGDNHAEL